MKIISDERNSSAISWLPEGNGFSISNRKKMNEEILPQYFKRSKYSSFTRKLNRWGFTCFTRGIGNCIYHHTVSHLILSCLLCPSYTSYHKPNILISISQHFHRDKPELVMKMCCSNSQSTFARAKQDQDVRIRDFQPATFEDHETAKNRVVRSLHAPPAVVSPDSILDPLLRMSTVNNVGLIPSQLQDGMALRGINPWNLASNILQNTTPSPLNYSYLNSTIMNTQNNNAQLQNMMLLNSLNLSHQLQVQGGQRNLMYTGNNDARQELLKQLLNSNL